MLGDPRNLVRLYETKADPGMFHRRFNNIWSVTSRARQRRFWKELQKLCGKAFVGAVAAAPADDTTFKDIVPSVEAAGAQQSRSQIY